jgi:mono/diheme cytochrome c family protein
LRCVNAAADAWRQDHTMVRDLIIGMRRLALGGVILLALAGNAPAQPAPQAKQLAEGHDLAMALCSVCHVAAADQQGVPVMSNPGPPFREIANKPGITPESLRTFLLLTHSTTEPPFTMPNPRLSDPQIDEMIAYILSLRGQN